MHTIVTIIAQYFAVIPALALVVLFFRLKRRPRWEFTAFVILSLVLTAIFIKIAGALHQDPRPFVRDGVTPYFSHPADNGFPSDHAAFSAAIAFVVLRYSRWLGGLLIVVAGLIGAARVIAGVHHGVDIFAGYILGIVAVAISLMVMRIAMARRSKTATPDDSARS